MLNNKRFFGAKLPVFALIVTIIMAGAASAFAAEAYFADAANAKLTDLRVGVGLTQTVRFVGQTPDGKTVKAFKVELGYDSALMEIVSVTHINGFQGAYNDDKTGKLFVNGFNVTGLTGNAALFEIVLKGKVVGSANLSITSVYNFGTLTAAGAIEEFIPADLIPLNVAVISEKIYLKDFSGQVVTIKTMEVGIGDVFTVVGDVPANETLKAFNVEVAFNPAVVTVSNPALGTKFTGAVDIGNGKVVGAAWNTNGFVGAASVALFSFNVIATAAGNANFVITVNNFGESAGNEFLPAPQNPTVQIVAAPPTTIYYPPTEPTIVTTTTTLEPGVTTTTLEPGVTTTTLEPGVTTTTLEPGVTTTTVVGPIVTTTTIRPTTTTTLPIDPSKPPVPTSPAPNAADQKLTTVLQADGLDLTKHQGIVWEVLDATGKTVYKTTTSSNIVSVPDVILAPNQDYTFKAQFVMTDGSLTAWSDPRTFKTVAVDPLDKTASGVPDTQDVKDGAVDLDGNGAADINQPNMKVAVNDIGRPVMVAVKGAGIVTDVTSLKFGVPADDSIMPFGTITFKALTAAQGGDAEFVIYLSEPIPAGSYWADALGNKAGYEAVISADGKSVKIKIKDGGPYDKDGVVNGIVVAAPAGIRISTPPTTIPGEEVYESHDNCFITTIFK